MSRMAWAWICERPKSLHESVARRRRIGRTADQLDDRIEVVQRNHQTLEDVGAFAGAGEIVLGPPHHHLAPVVEEVLEKLLEVEDLRLVVDHPEQDDAEGGAELGELEEVVLHHLGHGVALELDDDPDALAIGLVPQIRDALEALALHEVGDLLDQSRLVDLVRQLVDDDPRALSLFGLLDARCAPGGG